MSDNKANLSIYQCPVHPDFVTICVDRNLEGSGTRYFGGKCCSRQYERRLKVVVLDERNKRRFVEFIEELQHYLEALEAIES